MKNILLAILGLTILLAIAFANNFFVIRDSGDWNPQNVTISERIANLINTKKAKSLDTFKVPILMYHYIRIAPQDDTLGQRLSVTPNTFDLQMAWLKKNNYKTLSLADFADPQKKRLLEIVNEGKKPIILTFDDGYKDALTDAYPALKKQGFTGTFFIIRDFVGRPQYLNQNDLDTLEQNGMEIGAHTLNHPNLATTSKAEAKRQIIESKRNAKVFCYPSGKYDSDIVDFVKEAEYIAAVTTNAGIANQDSSIFELPRVRVFNWPMDEFIKKVTE